jgi:hypothetical protein
MPHIKGPSKETIRHALSVVVGYGLFFFVFFGPVVFSKYLLAPGDGISYFLPNYYSRTLLWDSSIWGGFPAIGDAQKMFWYPPALLLSWIPRSWDLFIISAYVLAASFTYGYTYSFTRSRLAAAISGLCYGLSGFMIAHIGHAAVVHTTAWLPLIVWAYAELSRRERGDRIWRVWFAIAAVGVACAALAGHPQMFTYVLALSAAFALIMGLKATMPRMRYYSGCLAALLIGIGLSAIQLVPTMELAPNTLRAALTFQEFVAYQLPLRQLPMVIFPFLYGGAPASFYATPYFGAWPSSPDGWGASELTGYVGLMPLMLAAIGFVVNRRQLTPWFWLAVAVTALLLVVGESTPLAFITYHLPIVNKFRAPARYFFAFSFAVSILAGLGVTSFLRGAVTKRVLVRTVSIATAIMVASLFALPVFAGKINELAIQRLNYKITLNPLRNPSLLVPAVVLLLAILALMFWQRRRISRARIALLLVVLVVDLASFAWFYEWRYRSPYSAYLKAPAALDDYRKQVNENHQRVLPIRGGLGRVSESPPDLSKLWEIPSATGYGPFVLTRMSRLLSLPPHGTVGSAWNDPADQSLDLLGVRYVLLPEGQLDTRSKVDERGLHWAVGDFSNTIGQGCSSSGPLAAEFELPEPRQATRIGIVGTLACSVEIPTGTEFAQLTITNTAGQSQVESLRAGQHFSEWAWDCSDVKAVIRHERAVVFSSQPAERGSIRCESHDYVALLQLPSAQEIKNVSFRWTGPPATFALRKITMIDDEGRVSVPVAPLGTPSLDTARWRLAGKIDHTNSGYGSEVKPDDIGASRVYENLRARPRAWLVPQVVQVTEEDALRAVHSSRLSDGRTLDLSTMAVVEEALPSEVAPGPGSPGFNGSARVKLLTDSAMEVETNSSANAFLLTSDTYYPGWKATVDGQLVNIYQADYLIRGVVVPAGSHLVRFEFRPSTLYVGSAVSIASLILLIGFCFRRPSAENEQS